MALQKTFQRTDGVQISYWHVHTWECVKAGSIIRVVLIGWLDKASHDNGLLAVQNARIQLDPQMPWDFSKGDPVRQDIYDYLKTLPDWQGATDC